MEQRELTAWALYLSEVWYQTFWLHFKNPNSLDQKKLGLKGKAHGIVLFDRIITLEVEL